MNQHWNKIKMPKSTGPRELHSHAAVFANQCMWIFGGEKSGKPSNDLWRYHFGELRYKAGSFDDNLIHDYSEVRVSTLCDDIQNAYAP